ncbi:MAG: DUF3084 domain-containing protein [Chloroflexi bacterium]|nr:DUF3084 domain-containing protein [Chloroflexota bacterium]
MLRTIGIFFVIAAVSGLIAYLGNQLGRYIGKKKMSFLNLRPRHTSIVFTVFTGMLIAILTVVVFAMVNENVKIFLTKFDILQKNYQELEKKNAELQKEAARLADIVKKGKIIFQVNEGICIGEVKGNLGTEKTKQQLDLILNYANEIAIQRNNDKLWVLNENLIPNSSTVVGYFPEEYESLISRLSGMKGNYAIQVYSPGNAYLKDAVPVRFNYRPNKLVFKEGELITSFKIDGSAPSEMVESQLLDSLQLVKKEGLRKGVLANPAKGEQVGDEPLSSLQKKVAAIQEKAREIGYIGGPVTVKVLAKNDIYTVGPLDIKFDIEPEY